MIDYTLIKAAEAFATGAHCGVGQIRKYTGEDYIVHPIRVATLVGEVKNASTDMVRAALLHDVVEDTEVTIETIEYFFGSRVSNFVSYLTKKTKQDYPGYNRRRLKEIEAARLAQAPYEVQTIKYADFIDNGPSIIQNDPEFAKVWIQEKNMAMEGMTRGDPELYNRALSIGW